MLALVLGRAATMARIPAGLPAGIRVSDHLSRGVIAKALPLGEVRRVLAETGRASERERDLPAHVMVYYAIALALYTTSGTREVLRCLLEGLRWLWGAGAVRVAGKSGISQARTRLGEAPLRRLYERVVRPVATPATKGAWYREWRLVSLDGSCLDVADTAENEAAFRRPGGGRGGSGFPPGPFLGLGAARAPSRRSASWRWSRTAPTCCSAPASGASRTARRRWRMRRCRRSSPACCAWPTGSSSATRSGRAGPRPAPTCCGG